MSMNQEKPAGGGPLDGWVRPLAARLEVLRVLVSPHPECHATVRDAQAEIERLTAALKKANDRAERFERGWYLRGDALEAIKRHCEPQPSALAAAIVATCDSGLLA